ncbi:MAG: cytochrome c [Rhodospirillaceae bacterium]|nr:cytochrome c [Rhodospirillaceae bacterium]MDD9918495.1 cytochrome c [Rhodospirillaceae bacterium]MDD9929363.1 cytochrome c [Rhodospirillaceae bacterium]
MTRKKTIGASVLAGALVITAAFGVTASQRAIFKDPVAPEMTPELNLGKLNYDAFCASCHGDTARGTDKGPTFISKIYHPGHHGDGAFFLAPKRGAKAHHWQFGDMPPVDGVNDQQLETILKYVRAVQQANGVF